MTFFSKIGATPPPAFGLDDGFPPAYRSRALPRFSFVGTSFEKSSGAGRRQATGERGSGS